MARISSPLDLEHLDFASKKPLSRHETNSPREILFAIRIVQFAYIDGFLAEKVKDFGQDFRRDL
ncbi:hypothetical protein M378DRAFT_13500 [Amanita muscaria Koide BX008]|uniref:Uncharacterized protein n=1 Tax=Amanita muscaria (strain Koide BX008) TaxID=946122 RepID=A0A0C2WX97_AMAMK|nr:hypothetical protein M378DRAFT_13500 [Amanita muscaria Koide BX008]